MITKEMIEAAAKAIFQNRGTWSAERTEEFFAIYCEDPRALEPEFALEVRESYRDAEAALTAALSVQWRGMESAPKDGTDILFYDPRRGILRGFWFDIGDAQHWSDGDCACDPIHWMPLPPPPTQE